MQVEFISLVNLIAGREVVKELIQSEATVEKVSMELKKLLTDNIYREKMLVDYEQIIKILDTGSASENAARLMREHLTEAESGTHDAKR
jgi:lipid-A-disaccharide synthase